MGMQWPPTPKLGANGAYSEWFGCRGRADFEGVDAVRNARVRYFIRICDHRHTLAVLVQLRHFRYLGPGYRHDRFKVCGIRLGDTLKGLGNTVVQT